MRRRDRILKKKFKVWTLYYVLLFLICILGLTLSTLVNGSELVQSKKRKEKQTTQF